MSNVLIVGAGPVGLTLAAELLRHGAACRLIEKATAPSPFCRAIGVTPRTLEVWEDMGVARQMIDAGLWLTGMRSIISGHPAQDTTAPELGLPYAPLGIPQYETERLLTEHLSRLGLAIERGVAFEGLDRNDAGVNVRLKHRDGHVEAAHYRYIVGCDGAHSAVRRSAGISFEGEAYPWPFMLGDVRIDWDLPYGSALWALRPVQDGPPDMFIAIPLPEQGRYRVSMLASGGAAPPSSELHGIQSEQKGPSLAELQSVADELVSGTPRLSDLRWSSVFRISLRLASQYRSGPIFIAGDSAHIHPPTGGQGMNTGIQDAYNLGWKLALVLGSKAPESILDSYEAERRPIGEQVLARTHAASQNIARAKVGTSDRLADTQILVNYRGSAWVRDDLAAETGGVPAGCRMPDVFGLRRNGLGFPLRLFDLLRGTEHVLLVPLALPDGNSEAVDLAAFARGLVSDSALPLRVLAITANELHQQPGMILISDPAASYAAVCGGAVLLVRPDGYVGWRGRSWRDPGLQDYLSSYQPSTSTDDDTNTRSKSLI
jgi:2-polyprenyl-6-methoxyphenol hydroxylase-like FAD-dependent oxidoreductase